MASTESLPLPESAAPTRSTPPRSNDGWLFAVTIFLSAFLLFQVQLLAAKYLLPWFGGAPAVWTTSMLFFQVLLLAGYFYAHRISGRLSPRRQSQLQIVMLAAALIVMAVLTLRWGSPITAGPDWRPEDSAQPIRDLLLVLTVSLGLPFFLLSTTSPLLQRWLATQGSEGTGVYRLYAVSNLGSLLGLISYPFLIEPNLRILWQARLWTAGFFLYAIFAAWCAWKIRSSTRAVDAVPASVTPVSISERFFWFALSACGSLLLLSTTSLVTEDMGVVPLMWVLPLTLYLLTFILCFSGVPVYRRAFFLPAFVVVLVMAMVALARGAHLSAYAQIYVYCFSMLVLCMVLHGELARRTPPVEHLTSFYLIIAAGGAAGGIFTGIIAPLAFRGLWEYPIGLSLAAALILWALFRDDDPRLQRPYVWLPFAVFWVMALGPKYMQRAGWNSVFPDDGFFLNALLLALPVLAASLFWMEHEDLIPTRPGFWFTRVALALVAAFFAFALYLQATTENGKLLIQARSFYGVLRVREQNPEYPMSRYYELIHGRIVHGLQFQHPDQRALLATYYTHGSGLGVAIKNHPRRQAGGMRLGAVGMGVGTVAAYARSGDVIRFYEINPQVVRLNLHEHAVFTYTKDSPGRSEVVLGDARLSMERELEEKRPQQYDVLILDAFSSDAIPVHLLTAQAFDVYLKHLRDDESVIAVHISNRAVDLKPVLAGIARKFGLYAIWVNQDAIGDRFFASDWIILSRSPHTLSAVDFKKDGKPLPTLEAPPLWTDDYSDLFSLIKH